MLPSWKLLMIFAKAANDHGAKIMHGRNTGLLLLDLGNAMQKQKDSLTDASKNSLMTAYDVLPAMLEIKILSVAIARQLDINTKALSFIETLDAIPAAAKAHGLGDKTAKIDATLDWTRVLLAHPEVRDIMDKDMTEIEKITSVKGLGRFFKQVAGRSQDQVKRLDTFLKTVKTLQLPGDNPATPSNDAPAPV